MQAKQISFSKNTLHCILFAVIPASLFYVSSLLGLKAVGFNLIEIIRDPAQQNGQSSFLGFVSNIGIWLWISAAAICLFSSITEDLRIKKGQRELLLLSGLLSAVLAVDDFFLIHDRYISQNWCYLLYMVLALTLLVRHWKEILKIAIFPFLLAGLLLALSIFVDLIQHYIPLHYRYVQVFEEGFKFIGAAAWLYFSCCIASFRSKPSI